YLYRVPIPAWVVSRLERYKRRVLYDFDDALGAADGVGGMQRLRQRVWERTIERAIRCCSVIVTSNQSNAGAVRARGGAAGGLPTCVDSSRYPVRSRAKFGDPITIGWIGTEI